MGKGSGGSHGSGRIEYPPYMTNLHNYMLYGWDLTGSALPFGKDPAEWSILAAVQRSRSGEFDDDAPYALLVDNIQDIKTIPDASDYLDSVDTKITAFTALVNGLSDDTTLNAAQTALEENTEDAHLRSLNRFTAQMSDVNATQTSAFIVGMALMESNRSKGIAMARAEWDLKDRYTKIDATHQDAVLELEYQKTKIAADMDELDAHVQYMVKNQTWDLEVFRNAGNLLGSISGAVSGDEKHSSRMQSALAGGLVGGGIGWMMGAKAGSIGGPPGAVIGGLIGLAGGALMG